MSEPSASRWSPLITLAKGVFTPLAVAFFAYFFWLNRETLSAMYGAGELSGFALVVLCWLFLHLLSPLTTCYALRSQSVKMRYAVALRIHISRLPAKYLPGGVWHAVARAVDYSDSGLDRRQVVSYLILENVLLVMVTLCLGGFFAYRALGQGAIGGLILVVAGLAGLALLLLPRLGHLLPGMQERLDVPPYVASVLAMIAYWCIAGFSFGLFLNAFSGLQLETDLLTASGVYIFSWGVGYLTIFAPQGLGVSELVSALLLGSELELGGLVVLLLGFRLLMAIADILCFVLFQTAARVGRRTPE